MKFIIVALILFNVRPASATGGHDGFPGRFLSCGIQNGRYILSIPYEVFGREMLFLTRMSGNAFGFEVYGAGKYLQNATEMPFMFTFEEFEDRVFMRFVRSDVLLAKDSKMLGAIRSNNVGPISYAFDIISKDTDRKIIAVDVSRFFGATVPWVSISSNFGIREADRARTGLRSVSVSEHKVEFKQFLTYHTTNVPGNPTDALTLEMTHTIFLLPIKPMLPRLDVLPNRFDVAVRASGIALGQDRMINYIRRWRLEPSDWQAYTWGQLVTPERPIVFYIDPSIPERWHTFVKRGVEDWNRPFERAGFRNAILAVLAEETDDDWQTPEMRAVIRYVPKSKVAFAGVVHDPRSGEILECSIQFGEDKIESIANQFIVQTAASNPRIWHEMLDSIKGELIRSVISHEVGHALGLKHYMGANRLYSVDSLRSAKYVSTCGLSPSIMDYVRGNYIAQPSDSMDVYYPKIGEADFWSIVYGYRLFSNTLSPADEILFFSAWNEEPGRVRLKTLHTDVDYELGDDAVYAATLGLNNLKTVAEYLRFSTEIDDVRMMALTNSLLDQYEMLVRSVSVKLESIDTTGENEEEERRALAFLSTMLFQPPSWLLSREFGNLAKSRILIIQETTLRSLLTRIVPSRIGFADNTRAIELQNQLKRHVFMELFDHERIGHNRRHLQSLFLTIVIENFKSSRQSADYAAMSMSTLQELRRLIVKERKRQEDILSKSHLNLLLSKINKELN